MAHDNKCCLMHKKHGEQRYKIKEDEEEEPEWEEEE
jgi:hypothetical protein